jgi:AcrR family transcriptional regulator
MDYAVDSMSRPVKSRRPYDATRRRETAARTRAAILDIAECRFLADGFTATTIAAIAEEAGVSQASIYKSFGGKPGLVRGLIDRGLRGAGPAAAEDRSDRLQAQEADPHHLMLGIGRLAAEVAPRVAPLQWLLIQAAYSDQEMAVLWDEISAERMARMRHNAEALARRGFLREPVSVRRAAETMWVYSSPELYQLLIAELGWTTEHYGAFIANALEAALLPTTH